MNLRVGAVRWACVALLACLAPAAAAQEQAGGPAVSPRLRYRARADVNGDGRPDQIDLSPSAAGGRLEVKLTDGRLLSLPTRSDAPSLPGLVAAANVNGRPGAELFVDEQHITTFEVIAIYTYAHGSLQRAGALRAYGDEFGIRYGLLCATRAGRHYIDQYLYRLNGSHLAHWSRQATVYEWRGSVLRLLRRGGLRPISGPPSRALMGVRCR